MSCFKQAFTEWVYDYRYIGRLWNATFPNAGAPLNFSLLERSFMSVLLLVRSLSIGRIWLLLPKPAQSEASELYVVLWLIILVLLLAVGPPSSVLLTFLIVGYRIIDGMAYRLCILFVDRHQPNWGLRSVSRTLLLLLINYAEIVVGFAILHWKAGSLQYTVNCPSGNCPIESKAEALYFSVVTATTVGYGDIRPLPGAGHSLVVLELTVCFVFVAVLLSLFLSGFRDIHELKVKAASSR